MNYFKQVKTGEYNVFPSLAEGNYFISIKRLDDEKTESLYRAEFFAKISELEMHTGYKKQEIYGMFKEDNNIESLSGVQEIKTWLETIEQLSWWAFNKLDIML